MSASKTEMIADWLKGQIQGGILRTGMKIPSEYDLAARFSVDKKTANKAVSELVTKKILERRRGGGGTIVASPSAMKGNIAVFMTGRVSYYYNLLFGFQEGAFRRGYNLYFYNASDVIDFDQAINRLKATESAGVIVTHLHSFPSNLPIPVLWVNDLPDEEVGKCNLLHHDNYAGGRMIAEHLINLGHRKIVYVAQNHVMRNLLDRKEGFSDTLHKHGINALSYEEFFNESLSAAEFVKRLLRRFPEVTAIACDGDNIAVALWIALRDLGLRIPEDVSLTGFSSLQEVQSLVKITTVDEKPRRIGSFAAELMADIIEGKVVQPVTECFDLEFIAGATSGLARGLGIKLHL